MPPNNPPLAGAEVVAPPPNRPPPVAGAVAGAGEKRPPADEAGACCAAPKNPPLAGADEVAGGFEVDAPPKSPPPGVEVEVNSEGVCCGCELAVPLWMDTVLASINLS